MKNDGYLSHVCTSVFPYETTRLLLYGFSLNPIFEGIFLYLSRTFKFHQNLARITFTLMKIYDYLYLTGFFLAREMFQTILVGKIKTHFMFNKFFRRLCSCMRYVEKHGTVWQVTGNIIRHMHLHSAYLRLQTHSKYVILIAFSQQHGYANASQCYILHT